MNREADSRKGDLLLQQLRGSTSERNAALTSLVRSEINDQIVRLLVKKGADQTEATSIFNDVLIAFAKRVIKDKTFAPSPMKAYLMSMAKYQLYDLLKRRRTGISMEAMQEDLGLEISVEPKIEQLIMQGEKGRLIEEVLSNMRTRCKEVLMYWSGGYSMQEIAKHVGYKSDMMARKKKSQCMKELMVFLADRPHLKQRLR